MNPITITLDVRANSIDTITIVIPHIVHVITDTVGGVFRLEIVDVSGNRRTFSFPNKAELQEAHNKIVNSIAAYWGRR